MYVHISQNTKPNHLYKLSENVIQKTVEQHLPYGFTIFSPHHIKNTDEKNIKTINTLAAAIKKNDFSFFPVYTGFIENKGTENERYHFIPFFIITQFCSAKSHIMHADPFFAEFIRKHIEQFNIPFYIYGRSHTAYIKTASNYTVDRYPTNNLAALITALLKRHLDVISDEYWMERDFDSMVIPPFCNPPQYSWSDGCIRTNCAEILIPNSCRKQKSNYSDEEKKIISAAAKAHTIGSTI